MIILVGSRWGSGGVQVNVLTGISFENHGFSYEKYSGRSDYAGLINVYLCLSVVSTPAPYRGKE